MSVNKSTEVQKKIPIPASLPSDWKIASLAEVAEVIMGQSPSSKYYNTDGMGLPFFQGKAEFGDIYPKVKKWCSEPNKLAQKDDVLLSVRAPVGPTNLSSADCCIGRGLAAIRPKNGTSNKYVLYYLRSIENDIESLGTGTTFKAISGKVLRELPIPVAPTDQQEKIVAEIEKQFSRLDEAVTSLKRAKANLKRYKAAVLKAAVEGKLTEEWRKQHPDVEPASELLKRILAERRRKWEEAELAKMRTRGKETMDDKWKKKYRETVQPIIRETSQLPETWTWSTIEQITQDAQIGLVRSKALQNMSGAGIGYLKMNNVTMAGRVIPDDLVYVDVSEDERMKYELFVNDILFNTRNSLELVGKTGLVKGDSAGYVFNNNLMRIRCQRGINASFVVQQMCSSEFRKRMEKVKRATTNVAAMYGKDLLPLLIALPPEREQEVIEKAVFRYLSLAEEAEININTNLKRVERVRQSILKNAFSGTSGVAAQSI